MAHDLSRARAILIGNGSFRHPQISAVPAEDCVAAVSELLTGPLCGWPAERITVLDDLATPDQLARKVIAAIRDAQDVLLVYYVGHGFRTRTGQLALALRETDLDPEALPHTTMLYANLADILRGCQAATKLVILDCCHAELGGKAWGLFQGADLADAYPVDGLYFIGASKRDEGAKYPEGGKLTYFTRALIEVVQGGIRGQPEELRLDQIFLEVRARLVKARLPEPVEAGIRGARQYPFARNAAWPGNKPADQADGATASTDSTPVGDDPDPAGPRSARAPADHARLSASPAQAAIPAPAPRQRRYASMFLVLLVLLAGLTFGIDRLIHLRGSTPPHSPSAGTSSSGYSTTSSAEHPGSSPSQHGTAGLARTRILTTQHSGIVVAVAVSSDRDIAAAFDFGDARIWKLPALGPPAVVRDDGTSDIGKEVVIYGAAFSPDGKTLAAGGASGIVYLLDLAAGQHTFTLQEPGTASANIVRLAFSADSRTLAVGDSYGNIYLWDVSTGLPTGVSFRDPGGSGINSLALAQDGKTLAEDDEYGGTVYLWNVSTGQRAGTLRYPGSDPNGIINSVAFSPDSKTLAAGALDGSVYLWDVRAGRSVTLQGPTNLRVNAVTFSPDGGTLAVGGGGGVFGGEVTLWNLFTDKAAAPLLDQAGVIDSVAFSNDGSILVAGDENGAIYVWPLR